MKKFLMAWLAGYAFTALSAYLYGVFTEVSFDIAVWDRELREFVSGVIFGFSPFIATLIASVVCLLEEDGDERGRF